MNLDRKLIKLNIDGGDFKNLLKEKYQNQKGVYTLHILEKNNTPKIIDRIFGKDNRGIIYIGMASNLVNRVSDLQKAIMSNSDHSLTSPKIYGHAQSGKKFFRIRKRIAVDSLYVKVYISEDPKRNEAHMLENYVATYGELPPLNGNYGHYDPDDWEVF